MIIKCCHCGFTKAVMESELMDNDNCDLCGGAMLFEQSVNYLEAQKTKEIKTETITDNIDSQLIASMILEIETYGEETEWKRINTLDIDSRLAVIPIYMEAKRLLR